MAKGKSGSKSASRSKTPITTSAAARIQSSIAKVGNGTVSTGSFAARAQRAAAKNSSK